MKKTEAQRLEVARLVIEMESLRGYAKARGAERSLDRAMSWLMDLTAEPLTDEEQKLWDSHHRETIEVTMSEEDPEQSLLDEGDRNTTREQKRAEARAYLKEWAEQMYNDTRHKWKALARLKPAERAKWLRRAKKMILDNADGGEPT